MNREKKLAKNTAIITIGKLSTQFITFLLLPLYTTILTTEEYGTVDLISTIVQLLIPIVSLMIDQGVFRYLLTANTFKKKRKVISNAFFLLLIFNVIFFGIYLILMDVITLDYKIWVIVILIITSFNNLFLQIARGLQEMLVYSIGSFLCSLVTILLNVLCIATIKTGAVGMLISIVGGNLICCVYLFFKLKIYKFIFLGSLSKVTLLDELRYSVPLIPNQLSLWIMNSSDRIIITYFLGAASNGILAISHKFPSIFMTFFNIFQLAWHETGAIHYFDDDRDDFFNNTIDKIIIFFSVFCILILLSLPLVYDIFVSQSFKKAYYYIPIYMVASLFNVVVGLLGVVYVATKNTVEIAKTTILAAIINIGVNLILIESIGLYAAAVSTFVGYLVTMIYRIHDCKKYLNIRFNKKHNVILAVGIVFSVVLYYFNSKLVSIITLPIVLILILIINKEIFNDILFFVKKR